MPNCKTCEQWVASGDECNVCACARILRERDQFGADEYDRIREYDKNHGEPGQRDGDRKP